MIVSDAHVHASLVDACRLARHGGLAIVPHNDVDAVAAALRGAGRSGVRSSWSSRSTRCSATRRRSSDLAGVAAEHDAMLVVDEAHAIGVAGGADAAWSRATASPASRTWSSTVTLSKALGSQGGAVLGDA